VERRYCGSSGATQIIRIMDLPNDNVIDSMTVIVHLQGTNRSSNPNATYQWIKFWNHNTSTSLTLVEDSSDVGNSSNSYSYAVELDDNDNGTHTASAVMFPTDQFVYTPIDKLSSLTNGFVEGEYELQILEGPDNNISHASLDNSRLIDWCLQVRTKTIARIVTTFFVDLSSSTQATSYQHLCRPYSSLQFDQSNNLIQSNVSLAKFNYSVFMNETCSDLFTAQTIQACLDVINKTREANPHERYFHSCEYVLLKSNDSESGCNELSLSDSVAALDLYTTEVTQTTAAIPAEVIWTSPWFMQVKRHTDDWFDGNETAMLRFVPPFLHSALTSTVDNDTDSSNNVCIQNMLEQGPSFHTGTASVRFNGIDWYLQKTLMKIVPQGVTRSVNVKFASNRFFLANSTGDVILLLAGEPEDEDTPLVNVTLQNSTISMMTTMTTSDNVDNVVQGDGTFLNLVGSVYAVNIENSKWINMTGNVVNAQGLNVLWIERSQFYMLSSATKETNGGNIVFEVQYDNEMLVIDQCFFLFEINGGGDNIPLQSWLFHINMTDESVVTVTDTVFTNISYCNVFDIGIAKEGLPTQFIIDGVDFAMIFGSTLLQVISNEWSGDTQTSVSTSFLRGFNLSIHDVQFTQVDDSQLTFHIPMFLSLSQVTVFDAIDFFIVCNDCLHMLVEYSTFETIETTNQRRQIIQFQVSHPHTSFAPIGIDWRHVLFEDITLYPLQFLLRLYNATHLSMSDVTLRHCKFVNIEANVSRIEMTRVNYIDVEMNGLLSTVKSNHMYLNLWSWLDNTQQKAAGLFMRDIYLHNNITKNSTMAFLSVDFASSEFPIEVTNMTVDSFQGNVICVGCQRTSRQFPPKQVIVRDSRFTNIVDGEIVSVNIPVLVNDYVYKSENSNVTVINTYFSQLHWTYAIKLTVSANFESIGYQPPAMTIENVTVEDSTDTIAVHFEGAILQMQNVNIRHIATWKSHDTMVNATILFSAGFAQDFAAAVLFDNIAMQDVQSAAGLFKVSGHSIMTM
ncbi:hypothetical protein RFI_31147, partial [Reticulomyxa filosa]